MKKFKKLTEQEFNEVVKCKLNPIYFIYNYCMILDPGLGKVRFRPYKYQRISLRKILSNKFTIFLKSRQMGMSWLLAAYALWLCLFFEDKSVLMISIKDDTAKALLRKIKFMYRHLPDFLRAELLEDNTAKMTFVTGSTVQSVPTSEEAGRSEALSLLIIDEAAFVRWFDKIWAAAYPTLSTGGQAVVLSTPNGMGNDYHSLWQKAVEGKSLFYPIRLHWYYHPKRGLDWLEEQRMNMSAIQLAQEVLGDFIASGNLVFDIAALRSLQDVCAMIEPVRTEYDDEPGKPDEQCGLHIFEEYNSGESYILSADTAKGGAGDYHAAHVLKRTTGEQVAEYRTRVPLPVFNTRLEALGLEYGSACLGAESNNMGIATNLYLSSRDYPNIYEYENPIKGGQKEMGFPTNSLTRPILINELENSIREGVVGVKGIRTCNELFSFAWNTKGKAEAQPGKHDDLVISLGIGRYIRATSREDFCLPTLFS